MITSRPNMVFFLLDKQSHVGYVSQFSVQKTASGIHSGYCAMNPS